MQYLGSVRLVVEIFFFTSEQTVAGRGPWYTGTAVMVLFLPV